jgi:hypothetical protein
MPTYSLRPNRSVPLSHSSFGAVVLKTVVACVGASYSVSLTPCFAVALTDISAPKIVALAHSSGETIGKLGGMPVKIPQQIASNVEYDSDSKWTYVLGIRFPAVPTYRSNLLTFEFQIRLPDMALLTTPEMLEDKADHNVYNTPWAKVIVLSGNGYPGVGFMNTPHISNGETRSKYWWNDYKKDRASSFGLSSYRLRGRDPRTGRSVSKDKDADIVYLNRDQYGDVSTRIDCSNAPHDAAICNQVWDMAEHGVAAQITVLYRRGHLQHWRDIQKGVNQVILKFRGDPPMLDEMPATPIWLLEVRYADTRNSYQ